MFDWNDEELTNIIWGDAGESDDHIVPYPDQVEEKPSILFGDPLKKEINHQTSNTSPPKLKNPPTKAEHGVELDSNCKYNTGEPETGFGHTSCSDGHDPSSSSSRAAKAELDSVGDTVTKNIAKSSECDSVIDYTSQFKKDTEIFENPPEDGEQGDFVDYGWANIGSFDDLDRIFSNQSYEDISTGHADELWSPSKDITGSPLGTTPLSGDSSEPPFGALMISIDRSEVKAEYMPDTSQPFEYKKLNEITSHAPQDVQASLDITEHIGGKSNVLGTEKTPSTSWRTQACLAQLHDGTAATPSKCPSKANRQKRLLKAQKLDKKSEARQLYYNLSAWSSNGSPLQQANGQYAPSIMNPGPPLVVTQQSSLPRPEPFQQNYLSGAPPLYGNMANHYPMTSVLPQFHPGDENHELMSSSYEVPPSSSTLKHSDNATAKPPAMTPREKIKKLRRRQQMRALHAIQKQQLQFGNQVSVSENSSMEFEGGKIEVDESLGTFPSLEPNSPAEQYDSNTINITLDNCSVEESVLYQLQDTIAKMDIQIRLCIRDSLSRLARSAVRRQYHNDKGSTSTSSRSEVLSNKDLIGHERFTRMPDVETDTNPIDRMVAHLLFNRPLEFSGKPSDVPNSPLSPNTAFEKGENTSEIIFSEGNQSKNCLAFITSENVSNTEKTDGVQVKVETSN